eukprot:scaffold26184_cov132-Cylindrotheca_fusiformis.AAC.5
MAELVNHESMVPLSLNSTSTSSVDVDHDINNNRATSSLPFNMIPSFSQLDELQDQQQQQNGGKKSQDSSVQTQQQDLESGPEDLEANSTTGRFDFDSNDFDTVDDVDVDDDDSSLGSMSSSSSSSGDSSRTSMEPMTLMEKRERNIERNAVRHRELFGDDQLLLLKEIKKSNHRRRKKDEYEWIVPESKPRGMLIKKPSRSIPLQQETTTTTKGIKQQMNELFERYPRREKQIRQLMSLFRATMGQATTTTTRVCCGSVPPVSVYVPAPIFVLGSSGTGKTSVVRETLDVATTAAATTATPLGKVNEKSTSSVAGIAYVNCSILEPSTTARLVSSIYSQLLPPDEHCDLKRFQRRRQKKRRKQQDSTDNNTTSGTTVGCCEVTKSSSPPRRDQSSNNSSPGNATKPVREFGTLSQEQNLNDTTTNKNNDKVHGLGRRRVQPLRAAKQASNDHPMTNHQEATAQQNEELGKSVGATDNTVENLSSVAVALGRSLQPFYGIESTKCAFVVLDQGPERLLTLSATNNSKHENSNILSELLLLPKVMRLNLTFVVITQNCTLHTSRLNNAKGSGKSLATISTGLHPILVQFPAYHGKECFLEHHCNLNNDHLLIRLPKILKTQRVTELIIGKYPQYGVTEKKASFFTKILHTFFVSIVQFLSDSTRDINNFVRLGRALWPVYIAPLHPKHIESTIGSSQQRQGGPSNSSNEAMILAQLGEKFLQYTAAFSGDDITGLLLDSSRNKLARAPQRQRDIKLPYLQSCLLLSAFICQHNRSDQDRKVFAAEGNGKKRKRNSGNGTQGDDEHIAYSSSALELKELQSLRPRPFQLERVFSIFVTLVRLNPNKQMMGHFDDLDEKELQNLGSSRLHDDLAQLIDLGYLHATSFTGSLKTERINFAGAKFWCSLTREEAIHIAKRMAIPLDNYIV